MNVRAQEALDRARRSFAQRTPRVLAPLIGGERLGAALVFDLDALRIPSGRWEDLCVAGPWGAARLLDLPLLALHDLGHREGAPTQALEAALLDAGALTIAAIFLAEAVIGAEAGHDAPSALLLGSLVAAATASLAGAGGPVTTQRKCARFADAWAEHAAALELVGRRAPEWTTGEALTPGVLVTLGRRHAPLCALFALALEGGGRPDLVPVLGPAIEELAGLQQLVCELDEVHRNLARGWWTLPVARLAAAVGALPADETPPSASPVLLALLITRVMPSLATEALRRVEALSYTFGEAGLGSVREGIGALAGALHEVLRRYDPAPTEQDAPNAPSEPPPVPFRIDPRPRREQALAALRAALDEDPEAREAWFTRSEDRVDAERVGADRRIVDRLSGPATVLENRVRAGERPVHDVDALLHALGALPDANQLELDTLATFAWLASHASDPEAARRSLEAPLTLALARAVPTGSIGVDDRGSTCAGVQARLALGLFAWPEPPARALLVARQALERVAAAGAEAFAIHDPLHGALLVMELVSVSRERSAASAAVPASEVTAAEAWALAFAARWRGRAATSPLAAAWLWLVTGHTRARALRDPRWRELLLCGQRAAGTWDARPFLREPAARPQSRLVTTSFVYRALVDEDLVR